MKHQHDPIFFTPPCAQPDRIRTMHKGGGGSSPDYQAEAEARRAAQASAFKSGIKYDDPTARDDQYEKLRNDVMNFQSQKLDTEYQTALRNNRQNLARQGLSGSSAAVDSDNELERLYQEQRANIGRDAEGSVNSARGGFEDSVARSMSLIQQGADAGTQITSALSAFSTKMQEALQAAQGKNFGGAFGSLASTADAVKLQQGAALANKGAVTQQDPGVAPIKSGAGSGGTVYPA